MPTGWLAAGDFWDCRPARPSAVLFPLRKASSTVNHAGDGSEFALFVATLLHAIGAHVRLSGNHTGPWLGRAATGKRASVRMGLHWHVVDGRIVEGWAIIDILATLHQFGERDILAKARAGVAPLY